MASKPIEIDIAADLLKLLSDRTRLTILKLLEIKELCVCELVELFNMSQPAISQHLRKLRDAKLVKEERRGQWVYYSLYKEHEAFIFVKNICDSIPSQAPLLKRYDGKDICCK